MHKVVLAYGETNIIPPYFSLLEVLMEKFVQTDSCIIIYNVKSI